MAYLSWYYADIICLVLIGVGTTVFWLNRHRFPISDRGAWMTGSSTLPIALLLMQYLVDMDRDKRRPCSLFSLAVIVLITPISFLSFLLRAWSLLFRFEITADLQGRGNCGISFLAMDALGGVMSKNTKSGSGTAAFGTNGIPSMVGTGGGPGGTANGTMVPPTPNDEKMSHYKVSLPAHHHSSQPTQDTAYEPSAAVQRAMPPMVPPQNNDPRREINWYTKNHHYMRTKYIASFFGAFIIMGLFVGGLEAGAAGDTPCEDISSDVELIGLGYAFIVIVIEMILVLVVSKKLAKFDRDALGLKVELVAVAGIVIVFAVILLPILFIIDNNEIWTLCIVLGGFATWSITLMHPLWLAHKHWKRQQLLAEDIQRVDNLDVLLNIPEAAASFAQFLAHEFCVESFVFVMRCKQFAATSNKVVRQLDHDRVVLLSGPSAAPIAPVKGLAGANSSAAAKAASWPPAIALREALDIDRNFVRDGSPFEVNVSARCKASIAKALAAASAAVLAGNRPPLNVSNTAPASPAQSPQAGSSPGIAVTINGLASPTPPPRSPGNGLAGTSSSHGGHSKDGTVTVTNGNGGSGITGTPPIVPLSPPPTVTPAVAVPEDPDMVLLKSIVAIFDEAVDEVKKLMMSNNWNRFRVSSQYRKLITDLQSHGSADKSNKRMMNDLQLYTANNSKQASIHGSTRDIIHSQGMPMVPMHDSWVTPPMGVPRRSLIGGGTGTGTGGAGTPVTPGTAAGTPQHGAHSHTNGQPVPVLPLPPPMSRSPVARGTPVGERAYAPSPPPPLSPPLSPYSPPHTAGTSNGSPANGAVTNGHTGGEKPIYFQSSHARASQNGSVTPGTPPPHVPSSPAHRAPTVSPGTSPAPV